MENNLESYLAEIEAELKDVPAARKSEFINEVRAHLHALCEAKRADGLDEATAWLHSMREFGEPEKVGRALWFQCLKSGRVEVKGEPLSQRQLMKKWFLLALITLCLCLTFIADKFTLATLGENFIYEIFMIEIFRQTTPANKLKWFSCSKITLVVSVIFLFSTLTNNLWRDTFFAPARDYFLIAAATAYFVFTLRSWKQELALRPWQWDKQYLNNPIAAEQNYRFWPIVMLLMTSVVLCIFTFSASLGLFGLPLAFLMGLAPFAAALVVGRWLTR